MKHSKKTKKILSEIAKKRVGILNSFFGKTHSEESRIKISNAHKGKKRKAFSEETKRKMREFWKGHKHSEETKNKIGEKSRGRVWSEESKDKIRIIRRGEGNGNWKGGITPLVEIIRTCFKNRQWRSDVFTKDNFTCVLCGKRGGDIEADHYPKMFSTIFHENKIKSLEEALACEEFWNINNGRTLCKSCHNKNKKPWHD